MALHLHSIEYADERQVTTETYVRRMLQIAGQHEVAARPEVVRLFAEDILRSGPFWEPAP